MPEEDKEKNSEKLQFSASATIEDVLGAGKGITKLFEIIERAFGRVTKPYFIKRDADAKAYEVRKLAEAIGDTRHLLGTVEYKSEGLTLSAGESPAAPSAQPSLTDRTHLRTSHQAMLRQVNIESVTSNAAEELINNQNVSEKSVDEDWINRFFNIAENIGADQMQQLWGKILAGEITNPGSYSLRTLDALKNITQEEAETFVKVAQAAFKTVRDAFIPVMKSPNISVMSRQYFLDYYSTEFGFRFNDILVLEEIGLMNSTELSVTLPLTHEHKHMFFTYGDQVILAQPETASAELKYSFYSFTSMGFQLLSLINTTPKFEHIRRFAASCQGDVKFFHAKILERLENGVRHADLVEVQTGTEDEKP